MSNASSAVMSNENTAVESQKGGKYYFDLISLSALKVEMVIMGAVLLYSAFKVVGTFVL